MSKMNLAHLKKKLLAAAKAHGPSDRVPFAFERRVMARLTPAPSVDLMAWWGRALWRSAGACVAICLLLGVWSALSMNRTSTASLSEDLEHTILASMDETDSTW